MAFVLIILETRESEIRRITQRGNQSRLNSMIGDVCTNQQAWLLPVLIAC
jgi:hypothetical protein